MKLIKVLYTLVIILFIFSCESFLEEEPPNFLDPNLAYETEEDIFQALVGAYDLLGSGSEDYYKRRFLYLVNFASDEMDPVDLAADVPLHDFSYTANDNNVTRTYQNIYQAIAAANAVITNVGNVSGLSADKANQLEGEARFLRALHHFNALRLWGDIVIQDKLISDLSETNKPRNPVNEVYQFIIDDLIFASDNMAPTNDNGRATSGAAAALLAKVYLTRAGSGAAENGDYQACVDACNQVINSSIYALTDDFEKAIGKEDAFNTESIFEFFTTRGGTTGNGELSIWGVFLLPVNAWTDGIDFAGINPDYSDQSPTIGTADVVSEAGFFNLFDARDYRRETTFVYRGTNSEGDSIGYDSFARTFPHCPQKFVDASNPGDRSGYSFSANIMILRYADVILMKAEALNELNDLDGAVTELNKIRTRARNGDGTGPWVETGFPENLTTALGQDGLRDAILYERTIELAFEGHRWFDLARTNRLISTLQSQGKAIQEKHKLFPIPDSQTRLKDTQIEQNPGW